MRLTACDHRRRAASTTAGAVVVVFLLPAARRPRSDLGAGRHPRCGAIRARLEADPGAPAPGRVPPPKLVRALLP
ncbi:hypothetical protein LT493_09990 [Streptomyces tricolor]|nr:hypothetical protein [Streptomyces tricolor]